MTDTYTPTYPLLPLGGLLKGKRALVTGVANDRSIAWAIAEAFHAEGAELAFTYPGEAMGKRVIPVVERLKPAAILDCDVGKDEDIDQTVESIRRVWDRVDVLVHSIGYAPREALDGRFTEVTSRDAWRITMDVSAYSLVGLARAFKPLMPPGSAIVSSPLRTIWKFDSSFERTCDTKMFPSVESSQPGTKMGRFFSAAASSHEPAGSIWYESRIRPSRSSWYMISCGKYRFFS